MAAVATAPFILVGAIRNHLWLRVVESSLLLLIFVPSFLVTLAAATLSYFYLRREGDLAKLRVTHSSVRFRTLNWMGLWFCLLVCALAVDIIIHLVKSASRGTWSDVIDLALSLVGLSGATWYIFNNWEDAYDDELQAQNRLLGMATAREAIGYSIDGVRSDEAIKQLRRFVKYDPEGIQQASKDLRTYQGKPNSVEFLPWHPTDLEEVSRVTELYWRYPGIVEDSKKKYSAAARAVAEIDSRFNRLQIEPDDRANHVERALKFCDLALKDFPGRRPRISRRGFYWWGWPSKPLRDPKRSE